MKIGRVLVGVGIGFIVFGAISEISVYYRLHQNWTPLMTPVIIRPGNVQTPEFVTEFADTYVVSLVFARNNPEREDCLMGFGLAADCAHLGLSNSLDLDWGVVRGGPNRPQTVVDYSVYKSLSLESGNGIGTELGRFDARRGENFKVLLRIRSDSPELNTASPKIRVEALGEDLEGLLMISEFVPWLAGFLGLVGIIVLIFAFRL